MAFRYSAFLALFVILGVAAKAAASTVVIDFEDGLLESDGFRVYASNTETPPFPPEPDIYIQGDENNRYAYALGTTMILERTDGGLFSLASYDIRGTFIDLGNCNMGTIDATAASGETLTFYASGSCDNSFQTQVLDSTWTNLVSVEFYPTSFDPVGEGYFDNLVVTNVIPLPPAAWLFFSALAAVAGLRRH